MINKAGIYLIELVSAAVHGTFVPKKPDDVSFTDVYNLAVRHSVDALTYLAVERLEEAPNEKLLALWSQRFYKSVINDTEQRSAYTDACKVLSECGAQYIPIKGIVMKDYYPEGVMRSMADVDLLYRHGRRDAVHKKMLANGYTVRSHNAVNYHDTYAKDANISVELHRSLLSKNDKLHSYFEQVWKRAKADSDGVYKMTREDEYLYLIAHQAKHFFESGLGIRPVLDIYLYRQAHADTLDMKYVRKILGRAKLEVFEKRISALADKWFSGIDSELVSDDIEEFFLACEPHGSSSNRKILRTQKMLVDGVTLPGAKRKYVLSQFFPPYTVMCTEYKSLKKAPILLPACWLHRMFALTFFEKTSVKKHFIDATRSIGESDEKDVEFAIRVYGYFM
ncbi:MAG: nucleotidyltransferase family protein [Clostridia bacterium]|nr:nucleotidyltransferase family protein [Clostridia bacterium]